MTEAEPGSRLPGPPRPLEEVACVATHWSINLSLSTIWPTNAMTNIDQFESVFKAANKTVFTAESVRIGSVLVVTGLDRAAGQAYGERARGFLGSLDAPEEWRVVAEEEFSDVGDLLELVTAQSPDLICTYRNVHAHVPDYPYSLGLFVEVLTQATATPVLLLPRPERLVEHALPDRRHVMAITDHLTGDHHLVSYAARLTPPEGTLVLSHVEDEATYERYLGTIAKIPTIDTDQAGVAIREQLLKEPRDYIESCRQVLDGTSAGLRIEEVVTLGHHLADYRRLVQEHQIDLLVMNTKDEEQLAMHGLAYPLAVELRTTPLLLL